MGLQICNKKGRKKLIIYTLVGTVVSITAIVLIVFVALPKKLDEKEMEGIQNEFLFKYDNIGIWGKIPGDMKIAVNHTFYLYHCANPQAILIRGETPSMIEIGPFLYIYEEKFENITFNEKNTSTNFYKTHEYKEQEVDALLAGQKFTVLNMGAQRLWSGWKSTSIPKLAIEGVYYIINLMSSQILYFKVGLEIYNKYMNEELNPIQFYEGIEIKNELKEVYLKDQYYGFKKLKDFQSWGKICDRYQNEEIFIEIRIYFGFNYKQMSALVNNFCKYYNKIVIEVKEKFCEDSSKCKNIELAFKQWANMELFNNGFAQNSFYNFTGHIELKQYYDDYFMKRLDNNYRMQFSDLSFSKSEYIDFIKTQKSTSVLQNSILYYENTNSLFEAGKLTDSPFRNPKKLNLNSKRLQESKTLNLTHFELICSDKYLNISKEKGYIIYKYLEDLVEQTLVENSPLEIERIAFKMAPKLEEIFEFIQSYLPSVLYSQIISKLHSSTSCEGIVALIFSTNSKIVPDLAQTLCVEYLNFMNFAEIEGWFSWVSAYLYPYQTAYDSIKFYLSHKLPNFRESDLELIYSEDNYLNELMKSIMTNVAVYYKDICGGGLSVFCSPRELAIGQWVFGKITADPFPILQATSHTSIVVWKDILINYLQSPFEYEYFMSIAGFDIDITMNEAKMMFTQEYLFNPIFLKKLLTDNTDTFQKQYKSFTTPHFKKYLKYFFQEIVIGPMFVNISGNDVFWGYTDLHLESLSKEAYYKGGDCSINPQFQFFNKSSTPSSSDSTKSTTLNTGVKDRTKVGEYMQFEGQSYVFTQKLLNIQSGDQCSITQKKTHSIGGTDGYQFSQALHYKSNVLYLDPILRNVVELSGKESSYLDLNTNEFKYKYNDSGYIDFSNITQFPAMITQLRYKNFNMNEDKGYIVSEIRDMGYKRLNGSEAEVPDAYFMNEIFTGLTLAFNKSYLVSGDLYSNEMIVDDENKIHIILPIFALSQSMQIPNHLINNKFGGVIDKESERNSSLYIGLILGFLLLIIIGLLCVQIVVLKPGDKEEETEELIEREIPNIIINEPE